MRCYVCGGGTCSWVNAGCVVAVPPRWLVEPTDVSVERNRHVALHCQAQGVPTPTIVWKKATGLACLLLYVTSSVRACKTEPFPLPILPFTDPPRRLPACLSPRLALTVNVFYRKQIRRLRGSQGEDLYEITGERDAPAAECERGQRGFLPVSSQ